MVHPRCISHVDWCYTTFKVPVNYLYNPAIKKKKKGVITFCHLFFETLRVLTVCEIVKRRHLWMMLYRCVHCRPHYQWYGKVNRKTSRLFQACFILDWGERDTAAMHLPVYKMNFPRKNPMKMAAMTTRREGREVELASRPRRLVEFVATWSERGTFLILTVSSCKRGKGVIKVISTEKYHRDQFLITSHHKWVKRIKPSC